MCPGVHVLDGTSRAMDCFVDALDVASWAQHTFVFAHDDTFRAQYVCICL